jgi:DNA-binding HxlR family transcriptional regulator
MQYGQYCPVAKAAEVLGERWTLLIVRDLMMGAHRFNDLERGLPGISRSLLSARLRHLEAEGLVERRASGAHRDYWLTPLGLDLGPAVFALGDWAVRNYGRDPRRDELDPDVLLLWIERNVHRDAIPAGRFVTYFDLTGPKPGRAWLVLEDGNASVCHEDPGFDVDITLRSDTATLYRVFVGRLSLASAMRTGTLTMEGTPAHRREFSRWFGFSPFSPQAVEARAS